MRRLKNTLVLIWALLLLLLAPSSFILMGSGLLGKVAKYVPLKEWSQWHR